MCVRGFQGAGGKIPSAQVNAPSHMATLRGSSDARQVELEGKGSDLVMLLLQTSPPANTLTRCLANSSVHRI